MCIAVHCPMANVLSLLENIEREFKNMSARDLRVYLCKYMCKLSTCARSPELRVEITTTIMIQYLCNTVNGNTDGNVWCFSLAREAKILMFFFCREELATYYDKWNNIFLLRRTYVHI